MAIDTQFIIGRTGMSWAEGQWTTSPQEAQELAAGSTCLRFSGHGRPSRVQEYSALFLGTHEIRELQKWLFLQSGARWHSHVTSL